MTDGKKETDHSAAHDISMAPFDLVRYTISLGLLVFSIVLVGALIFTENTRVAKESNPWVALIVCVSSAGDGDRGSLLFDGRPFLCGRGLVYGGRFFSDLL